MARFLLLFFAVFVALAVNAEDEKILSDEQLEITNDEPVQDDEELLYDRLTQELQDGKRWNIETILCFLILMQTSV